MNIFKLGGHIIKPIISISFVLICLLSTYAGAQTSPPPPSAKTWDSTTGRFTGISPFVNLDLENDNSAVIVLGEAHNFRFKNKFYGDFLTEVKRSQSNMDCLLLEIPSNFQGAMANDSFEDIFRKIYQEMKALGMYSEEQTFEDAYYKLKKTLPLSEDLLETAKRLNVQVFFVDRKLTPQHLKELNNLNAKLMRTFVGKDQEIIEELVQIIFKERNQIMAANIQEKFSKNICNRSVMITGLSHLSVHGPQADFPNFSEEINTLPGELRKLNNTVSSYLALGVHCINMNNEVSCYNTYSDESLCEDADPDPQKQCQSKLWFRDKFLFAEVADPQEPSIKGAIFSPLKFKEQSKPTRTSRQ